MQQKESPSTQAQAETSAMIKKLQEKTIADYRWNFLWRCSAQRATDEVLLHRLLSDLISRTLALCVKYYRMEIRFLFR